MTTTFSIVLTGAVLPGHEAGNVAAALAKLLRTTEEKAAGLLLGRETVVKRNVEQGDVDRYLRALSHAGAEVLHRPMPVTAPAQAAAPQPSPRPAATSAPVSAAVPAAGVAAAPAPAREAPEPPVHAAEAGELALVEMMICPSCGHSQPKRTLCLKCSCDMPRMLAAKEKEAAEPKAPPEPAYWASPRANVEDVEDEESATPSVFALSVAGRIGRLRYLAWTWPILILPVLGAMLAAVIMPRFMILAIILLVPCLIVGLWSAVRLMAMRLHDLNRSGKWVLLMFLISAGAGAVKSPTLMIVGSVIFWVVSIALMLWPGTGDTNDYGPPPGPNTTLVKVGAFALIAFQVIGTIGALSMMRSAKNGALEALQRGGVASRSVGEIKDPVYAEIRIEQEVGGRQIEMAYFGKMNGEADCQEQAARIRTRMLSNCKSCVAKTLECRSQLQPRHASLFDNEPSSLTYLSMAQGDPSEREGRLVFWGLSVPESNMVCDSLAAPMQQSQKGRVQCIRASGS